MFDKILIANRGEIACRVIRTAQRLGIRSVVVYSEADRNARHVALSDEAYCIGPAPAQYSYLNIDAILDSARRSGAQAIHPGYGFLAENPEFAGACTRSGVVFIGPSAAAIRAMGSKSTAKNTMHEAGIPLIPGYHGSDQAIQTLQREADAIGYPVLVKAAAGGGGKGMRVVTSSGEFVQALASAKREAAAAFADDTVLLERFVARPRHIEFQIFGDSHGNIVHLYERDCSVQRRHQKVIEEAPAPHLSAAQREAMANAAVTVAKSIDYVGAGTVEFLVDEDGAFYFMEMNTRLQVEHPITEMITAQDLVEWQFRVAAGEPLPLNQNQIEIRGHAIEARVYAEDPTREFLPTTGRLTHLRFPKESPNVRVESGVQQDEQITIHYDPMIAKLVVWDQDRDAALRRLGETLGRTQIVGVTNNVGFLAALAKSNAFTTGEFDTGALDRDSAAFVSKGGAVSDLAVAMASLGVLIRRKRDAARRCARRSNDPFSPWNLTDGWRLNEAHTEILHLLHNDTELNVEITTLNDGYDLRLPSGITSHATNCTEQDGDLSVTLDGVRHHATVILGEEITVFCDGETHRLRHRDRDAAEEVDPSHPGNCAAPMPGRVMSVLIEAGACVRQSAPLIVLEAMKMEHTIKAPGDGRVARIHVRAGDLVDEGDELLEFEASDGCQPLVDDGETAQA